MEFAVPSTFRVNRGQLIIVFLLLLPFWGIIWTILNYDSYTLNSIVTLNQNLGKIPKPGYLVNSLKCQIIDLDPFNKDAMQFFHPESYEQCSEKPPLTYIAKTDNGVILKVNEEAVPYYLNSSVVCCYSNVTRSTSLVKPDDAITTTKCRRFKDNVTLHHDTIFVKCLKDNRYPVYKNTHYTFMINEDIKNRITRKHTKKQISVLLVGIDSVSRLNFIRALPKSYSYVESNEWVPLKGYNKVDDNTFPNFMAILTGFNRSNTHDFCDPKKLGQLDKCPMLWYAYKNLDYVTSYAEDEVLMGTFNHMKKGFSLPPTDFYLRPYMMSSEKLKKKMKQGMTYCTGPETSGERILKLAKDFAVTFKAHPHFGWFWMNTFSHNDLNTVSIMDNKIKEFLETLSDENVLEESVVIFFSDHGIRFGDIRLTDTGWLEERLPFIYVSFPNWFKETFPNEFKNFKANSDRLTSPYDLHMTLQHLLVLSGHENMILQSAGCPKCKSLLEVVDEERSCEEAGIEQHWCTCSGYIQITLDRKMEDKVSTYVLNKIHKIIASYDDGWMCAKYTLNSIISTSVSQKLAYTSKTYLLLRFNTTPEAVFESTIGYEDDISDFKFSISGRISRLDVYATTSNCTKNPNIKEFCYCVY